MWQEVWANAARKLLEQIQKIGDDNLNRFKLEAFAELEKYHYGEEIYFKRKVIYAYGNK